MTRGERVQYVGAIVRPVLAAAAVFTVMLLALSMPARATQEPQSITININANAGIAPTSSLYVLDVLAERLSIWFTQGGDQKVERLLELANEKVTEVAEVAPHDAQAAGQAANRYEVYIREAARIAQRQDNTDGAADTQLATISDAIVEHVDALVTVGGAVANAEKEYLADTFETIGEQETEVIAAIEDEEERQAASVRVVERLIEIEDRMSPLAQEYIGPTLTTLVGAISSFVVDQGGALLDTYGDTVQQYIRTKANEQLDKAKDSLIEEIQDFEL